MPARPSYSAAVPGNDPLPTRIEQQGPRELAITWSDGDRCVYPVRELRLACACASCVDDRARSTPG